MAADLFKLALSPHPTFHASTPRRSFTSLHRHPYRSSDVFTAGVRPRRRSSSVVAKAVEIRAPIDRSDPERKSGVSAADSPLLLDVSGMMCGGCVSRVKGILSADDRVESAVVNMLTETAAVKLKAGELDRADDVAESLARRLSECGFESRKRDAGTGVAERVREWKETLKKREELLDKSRNRVVFAWTLVALCCGSHASHILHSLGIHVAHGGVWDLLHSSYFKGGLALGALFGPGRDLLFDGFKAFGKGSPNMNSLVGFGSLAAFTISAVSLLNPELQWDATFFDEPVMLLGFVLLGRSLEERARIKASSDMNELLSLISTQSRLVVASSEGDSPDESVLSSDTFCVEIPTDDIRVGDSVLVLPGETIPVDGKVIAGRSVVDESMLSGESLPVFKEEGLAVSAGTINWDGPLRIQATSTGSNSTISNIIRMVEDAQGREAPIQRLADSIAGPFVFSVMTLSAATFAFWYSIGTHIFPDVLLSEIAGPDENPLLLSLKLAVDVLVVSCPCALGLATPTAVLVGTSLATKGIRMNLIPFPQLNQTDWLPECLRIIGYLRRIGVFSEYELRLQFLRCRESWLIGILDDLDQRNPYEYLKGMVSCHRMHLFDVVNQYRAIFADDTSGSEENYDGGLLFSWAMHQITAHLKTLKVMLPKIKEGVSLSNILEQCMYCAMGLGWVGLDFRGLLPSLFEEAVLNLFKKNMSSAVENFQLVLDSHRWVPLPTVGFSASTGSEEIQEDVSPPPQLMEHPPLAVFVNGVSSALNELRACAPLSLKYILAQELVRGLRSVHDSLLRYNEARLLRESESVLFFSLCRAFVEVVFPHTAACFGRCYPDAAALITEAKSSFDGITKLLSVSSSRKVSSSRDVDKPLASQMRTSSSENGSLLPSVENGAVPDDEVNENSHIKDEEQTSNISEADGTNTDPQ